jgi:regulator of sigma E protease
MSIVIFIIILAILILVHEFGHFIVAKFFKIRVDEFGIGYPPRAATLFEKWGTKFTLNWIPFGGFVKIFGENGEDADPIHHLPEAEASRSFVRKPRYAQALVLVAGVAFNLIFAWILISSGFLVGLPTSTSGAPAGRQVENPRLVITMVSPDSPAAESGLKSGDTIVGVESVNTDPKKNTTLAAAELSPESVSEFIAKNGNEKISISYSRGEISGTAVATPKEGIISNRKAIGISMDKIGVLKLPVHAAFWEGAVTTLSLTKLTAVGLVEFVYNSVRGQADLSQVTGPVGIVGLVGDASKLGVIYLISFTAFISINLAVINLIPFPALDGGRLLFVIIESIKRSPISPKVANVMNTVGFFLLIGLMVVVTVSDVIKLF